MNLALCTRLLLLLLHLCTPVSRKITRRSTHMRSRLPTVISRCLALIAHFVYDTKIYVVYIDGLIMFISSIFTVLTRFEIEEYEGFLEFRLLSLFILLRFDRLHIAFELVIRIFVDYLVTRVTLPLVAFVLAANYASAFRTSFVSIAHCVQSYSLSSFTVRSTIRRLVLIVALLRG